MYKSKFKKLVLNEVTAICDTLILTYKSRKIQIKQIYLTVFGLKLLINGKVQYIDGYVDIFLNLWKINCKN
jgi:hypothetical protein